MMFRLTILLAMALTLTGCGGGGGGGGDTPPSTTTLAVVKVMDGKTDALIEGASVTITPAGGAARNAATDASGNCSFAEFPVGTATIVVTDPKLAFEDMTVPVSIPTGVSSYSIVLRMLPKGSPQPTTVTISPDKPTIGVGSQQQFTVTVTPDPGVKPTFALTGSIGTLSDDGIFTATTAGTGTILVMVGSAWATTTVTVVDTATTGTVHGVVKDDSGSNLPGVTVTVGTLSAVSDATGSYSISGLPSGTHVATAKRIGYSDMSGNATLTPGSTLTLNITMIAAANLIRVGHDKTITICNHHDTWFGAPDTRGLRDAAGGHTSSGDNTASASESRGPGASGEANARVGVDLQWDTEDKTWDEVKSTTATVTVTLDYTIQASYTSGTGTANAAVKVQNLDATGTWLDSVGSTGSGTITQHTAKVYTTTLAQVANRVAVLAYAQAAALVVAPASTVNSASAEVTITSIKIAFP